MVIKILDKYNAKASFFCIGNNVEKYPLVYKKTLQKGHQTANHTFNHSNGWKTKNEDYYADIEKCSKVVDSYMFRPPYGRITHFQIAHLKMTYRIFMWSVLSYDFSKKITPQQCLENVNKNAGPGSIVVFHDSEKASKNMLYALPRVLDYFSQKGYRFETLKVQG